MRDTFIPESTVVSELLVGDSTRLGLYFRAKVALNESGETVVYDCALSMAGRVLVPSLSRYELMRSLAWCYLATPRAWQSGTSHVRAGSPGSVSTRRGHVLGLSLREEAGAEGPVLALMLTPPVLSSERRAP